MPPVTNAVICHRCHSREIYRVHREGLLQKVLFSFLGFYPWHCSQCRRTFLLRERGSRRTSGSSLHAPVIEPGKFQTTELKSDEHVPESIFRAARPRTLARSRHG